MSEVTRPARRVETTGQARGATALVALVALVIGSFVVMPSAGAGAASNGSAPTLKSPEATARKLVTAWLTALKDKDSAEIAASLAPNFQIERADGSGQDRAGYLAKPAVVTAFTLGDDMVAIQSGGTLTVRWGIKVSEQIGDNQFQNVEAPRLTTFIWQKGRWKILSYANFNPIPAAVATPT